MATHDPVDPAQDAEQRAERAKASLLSRVEMLKHKLSDAKHKLDLPTQISKHAIPAVAIAFTLGVTAGLRRSGAASSAGAGRGALWSAFAAIGVRALRELALGQLGRVARQWWEEQGGAALESGHPPPTLDRFVER